MSAPKYTDALRNSALATAGWRWTAILSTAVTIAMAMGMVMLAANQSVVIIPHSAATLKGPVTVYPGNHNQGAEYLGALARDDVGLALTWTPQTVGTQYSMFMNRMTPSLYAAQNVKLIADAEDMVKQHTSQVFFPAKIEIAGENKVQLTGILARWEGEKQTYRKDVSYVVAYENYNGFFHVNSITAK